GEVEKLQPLLLVERHREAAEPVDRDAALLAHLDRHAAARGGPAQTFVLGPQAREPRGRVLVPHAPSRSRGGGASAATVPPSPRSYPSCARHAPSSRTVAWSRSAGARGRTISRSMPAAAARATRSSVSGSKVVREISSGRPPTFTRSRRSSATIVCAFSTVSPKPYQPSPTRAARRSAGPACPPMTIGGCGRCSGFGSTRVPSNAAKRPA